MHATHALSRGAYCAAVAMPNTSWTVGMGLDTCAGCDRAFCRLHSSLKCGQQSTRSCTLHMICEALVIA
eukprot:6044854-Alexandrium_andersonii.AAC.1